jgi:capsular exopolysaccharide synthesis family protein
MSSNISFKEKTVRDYIVVFFRHKKIIISCFITVLLTVLIGLEFITPVYEAQVKMLISGQKQIESEYYREDVRSRISLLSTQSEIVKSKPVLERAVNVLNFDKRPVDYERNFCSPLKNLILSYKLKLSKNEININKDYAINQAILYLQTNIVIDPIQDTNIFLLKVTDYSPEQAAAIANVISRSYIIFDLQQQLVEVQTKYGFKHPAVQQLRETIWQMDKSLSGKRVSILEAIGPASVKIIEQADIPTNKKTSEKKKILAFAIIFSLVLGVGISLLLEILDQSIRNPQDIISVLNLPVLGSIPHRGITEKELIEDINSNSKYTKFFKELADQVNIFMLTQNIKSILFISTLKGEGVSTIISNLSICFANELGYKTLLIDTNLRNPSIHNKFSIKNDCGFIDLLNGKEKDNDNIIQNINQNLKVITSQKVSDVSSILNKTLKEKIFLQYKNKYDAIFIDCAQLGEFTDAATLASSVDGIILVVEEGKVRRQVILKTIETLLKKNKNIVGVVFNKRTFPLPNFIYKNL